MRAEQITEACTHHGEGAFWDESAQRIRFVDMVAGDVVTLLPTGTVTRRHVDDVAAVIRARRDGGYLVAGEHAVHLLDEHWLPAGVIDAVSDPSVRLNEGGCDAQGRFYCGSMAYDGQEGAGVLYRFDPDRTVHEIATGMTVPNGLVWSADGNTAFHSDSGRGIVAAYDVAAEEGLLRGGRPFVSFDDDDEGVADGMAIDEEDGVWMALYGGGQVRRYTPDGAPSEVIDVPGVTRVTSCAFGGPGRRTLFITTSREDLGEGDEPAAGALFAVEVPVAGAPLTAFAG